jgi:hypothetical protein
MGLTERLAAAMHDKRHQSYSDHPLRDLFAQRIYQIAAGYADANEATSTAWRKFLSGEESGIHRVFENMRKS